MSITPNTLLKATYAQHEKMPRAHLMTSSSLGKKILIVIPFEYRKTDDVSKVCLNATCQHDFDSFKANEPKESRASITMIPAFKFDTDFLKEITDQTGHVMTNQTDLALRLYLYFPDPKGEGEDVCVPFFGTIEYDGEWKYVPNIIKTGTLAYEYAIPLNNEQKPN